MNKCYMPKPESVLENQTQKIAIIQTPVEIPDLTLVQKHSNE